MSGKVERREREVSSLSQAVADIERLAAGEVRVTGKHSFGQIIHHLALSLDMSAGRVQPPPIPWYMKLMTALFRSMLINDKPLKPGFKLPKASEDYFWPDQEFDVQQSLAYFKEAVQNYDTNGPLEKHPVFGEISHAQNLSLSCRHCAMHLSFVHPVS